MFYKAGLVCAATFLTPLLLVSSLGATETGPRRLEPTEAELRRLEARSIELNQAINRGDWAAWHEMTSPARQPRPSLDDFKKELRLEQSADGWRALKGELKRGCGCREIAATLLRCVFIIEISVKEGTPRRQVLETWELWNKEWYWLYRDFHDTHGHCPKDTTVAGNADPAGWLTYSDPSIGFRISYPPDWKVVKPPESFIHFQALAEDGFGDCTLGLNLFPETANATQRDINRDVLSGDPKTIARQLFAREGATLSGAFQNDSRGIARIGAEVDLSWQDTNGRVWRRQVSEALFTPGRLWGIHCGVNARSEQETQRLFSKLLSTFSGISKSLDLLAR